jgi:hypothetical protein
MHTFNLLPLLLTLSFFLSPHQMRNGMIRKGDYGPYGPYVCPCYKYVQTEHLYNIQCKGDYGPYGPYVCPCYKYVDEHLYNIQCGEICTLRNEKLHTEA